MSAYDLVDMATAYQRSAVLTAACRTGLADVLAHGPLTVAEAAARANVSERGAQALVGAMGALGLVDEVDGRVVLSAEGAPLASDHPETVARIVAKEAVFYEAWASLTESVRTSEAVLAPWSERLAADPATGLTFLHALDDLGRLYGMGLADLVPPLASGARVLDAGGGSGVHAARLVARHGVRATVLDLPEVGELVARLHPELAFVAGDIEAPRLSRPAGETWDAVLLANLLHDGPAARAQAMVAEAAGVTAPGGVVIVYEWLNDPESPMPGEAALFDVMMMVENPGGAAWPAAVIEGWLGAAGLTDVTTVRGGGPIGVVWGRRPA